MSSSKRIRIRIIFPSLRSLSAEIIANNDDLLTQILLRLPIKSLLKFKCISKHWLSLISSPLFYLRLHPSNSPCALFLRRRRDKAEYDFVKLNSNHFDPPFKTLNFIDHTLGIGIIDTCNGLLSCSSFCKYLRKSCFYICNPTTKQWKLLPPLMSQGDEIADLCLAFDPRKSPYYKVISVHQDDISEPIYRIIIYSSETDRWASSAATFTLPFDVGFYGGVFWNDSIHWYTDSGPCMRFDINQEKVKEMPMPPMPDDWYRRRVRYFGKSREHLHLVEIYNTPSTQFKVCEMKRDYSEWFVKYKVNLEEVVSAFPGMIRAYLQPFMLNYYVFEIHSIVRGESDDKDYLVLHIPTQIIRYNLKDGSFEKLFDFGPDYEDASSLMYCNTFEFIESLACV